jgi:Metallo-beta-lactamase superfamily
MHAHWTRRQFLTRVGLAAAAVQTIDHLDLCCTLAADAVTTGKDLFEFQPVADGVYAAVAAPQYKVNSNAAVILTNDGVVVVDSHSKPSAAQALYQEIRGVTKHPVRKVINTHFHWDHWQGNQIYCGPQNYHYPILTSGYLRRCSSVLTSSRSKTSGIELATDPFQHTLVLGMLRVADRCQKTDVSPDATAILGGTGTVAGEAERVVLPLFPRQYLFNEQLVFPAIAKIILIEELALFAPH